mgnify:FL=1
MFDVIIPIYNVEKTLLLRCFDSVVNQSFTNYTVWVCDGKPTPENKKMVESYNFNYIEQDTDNFKRVGGARNQISFLGDNPYIAFLDGDDWWYMHHLKEMKNAIQLSSNNTAVWSAVCDCVYELQSLKTGEMYKMEGLYGYYEKDHFLKTYPQYSYYWFFGHPPAPTTTVVERNAFELVGGFDSRYSILEDTECWMRIVGDPRKKENHKLFESVPVISGYHHIGIENTTSRGSQSPAFEKNIKEIFSDNSDLFLSEHPRPLKKDKPEDVKDSDWDDILKTVEGVNRNQIFNI